MRRGAPSGPVLTRGSVTRRPSPLVRSFSVWILSSLALLVGLVALGLGLVVLRAQAVYRRAPGVDALPEDVHGLRQEVAALRLEAAGALRHLAVVRYDAFGDMGGQMSWSLALVDDGGNGVVVLAAVVIPFGLHALDRDRALAEPATATTATPPPTSTHPPQHDSALGARGDLPALLPALLPGHGPTL